MLEQNVYWAITFAASFASGCFLVAAGLEWHGILRNRRERRRKAAAAKKMSTDEYFIVKGPVPAGCIAPIQLPSGYTVLVTGPIAEGDEVHVDRNTGEFTLFHKADRNLTMDHGSFSLDELEQAKEYLNSGGKLH